MFSATRARTRRATWAYATASSAVVVLLLVGDLVFGWKWWHIGLAAVNALSAAQLARGALRWHEPKRALSSTDRE